MKRSALPAALFLLVLLAAPACVTRVIVQQPVAAPPPAHFPPGASAAVEQFHDDLSPYGTWIEVDGPGWVWRPARVQAGWRPYTLGRWVYSDFGWTWASDESWGWAVYHHGRWHHAPGHGWVWVPGTEWGPAWVTWHSGGGWIGWAPLPWQVAWRGSAGLDWGRVDVRVAIQPAWWCFVPTRHLTDPSPARHFAPPGRNTTLIKITRNVTNYTLVDNRVFNRGVLVNEISKATGRPVHPVRVRQTDSARAVNHGPLQGDELVVYRPGLRRGQDPDGTPGHQRQRDREAPARSGATDRPAPPDVSGNEPPPSKETPAADRQRPVRPWESRRDRGPARDEGRNDENVEDGNRGPHPPGAPEGRPADRPGHKQDSGAPAPDSVDDSTPSGSAPAAAGQARPKTGSPRPAGGSPRPASASVSKDDDRDPATPEETARPQAATPRPAKPKPGVPKGRSTGDQGREAGKKKDSGSDKKEGKDDAEAAPVAPSPDETEGGGA